MCVISFGARRLARLTAALALGLGACATGSRPPEVAGTAVHCAGGTLTSGSGAAVYRACNVINGDLRVLDTNLTDLSALAGLYRVSGSLVIARNAELSDLHGLERLRSVGALVIRDNAGLHSTRGLSNLTEVGDLVVARNATLISLGIDSLKRTRSLQIRENPRLCARGMLAELERVEQPLVVSANWGISQPDLRRLHERVASGPRGAGP